MTCLAGLLAAGVAFPGVAVAGGSPVPAVIKPSALGGLLGRAALGATSPQPQTVTASYTCDFSAYASGGASIPTATDTIAFEVSTPWPVSQPDDIGMTNDTLTLPSAVTSQLTGTDSIVATATVTVTKASAATVAVTGALPVGTASAPAAIDTIAAQGQVTFPATGTATVALPPATVTFTPMKGTTAEPVITCTTTQAVQNVSITVGKASGPFYNCTLTIPAAVSTTGQAVTQTQAFPVDATLTASGTKQVGKKVTVKLDSTGIETFIAVLAAALNVAGAQLTKVDFSSSTAVSGAQSGTLTLAQSITTLPTSLTGTPSVTFDPSGTLKLTKAGAAKITIPKKWTTDFSKDTTKFLDVACTLVTSPAPTGVTITTASASGGGGGGNGGTGEDTDASPEATSTATGTPAGAPDTGGGIAPGGSIPLVLGGIAILLAGGGLLTRQAAQRRRRR